MNNAVKFDELTSLLKSKYIKHNNVYSKLNTDTCFNLLQDKINIINFKALKEHRQNKVLREYLTSLAAYSLMLIDRMDKDNR